ncbi:MAG: hypothetical protein JW900_08115 [Anaerolineae bacterium]|nr:hypothetical protein [Anaerolineae bacterium]
METVQLSPELVLILVAALVVAILVLRFAREIGRFLLVASGIGVAGIVGWALLAQARATQQVAETATVTSKGQAAAGIGVTVLAVLLAIVVAGAGGVVGYLLLRLRWAERRAGQWAPGPNARWGQMAQPGTYPQALPPYPVGNRHLETSYPYASPPYLQQAQPPVIYVLPAVEEEDDLEPWGWGWG